MTDPLKIKPKRSEFSPYENDLYYAALASWYRDRSDSALTLLREARDALVRHDREYQPLMSTEFMARIDAFLGEV